MTADEVRTLVAELDGMRDRMDYVAPADLMAYDDLYESIRQLGRELEHKTWTVAMLGRPRRP